jgi:hypothetical protein
MILPSSPLPRKALPSLPMLPPVGLQIEAIGDRLLIDSEESAHLLDLD